MFIPDDHGERGYGQKVKGINDVDGEVTGIAVPNGRFSQLQICMGIRSSRVAPSET